MPELNLKHDIVPERADLFTIVTPTTEEAKLFSDGLSYLVFKWGLFAQLIYSDMPIIFTEDVPIAATDSHSMFLNPRGFKAAGIEDILEIAFVQAHEVSHKFLDDLVMLAAWQESGMIQCPTRVLPFNADLMNKAKDYRINAMLVHAGVGKMPKVGLYDPAISREGMESSVEIYDKLWDDYFQPDGKGGWKGKPGKVIDVPGPGKPGSGFDKHLKGKSSGELAKDKAKRDQSLVAAAQLAEKQRQGSVPGAFARMLDDILNPKIDWTQHLRTSMTRKAGEPKLDWRYLNRRLASRDPEMYYAKRGHKGAGKIVWVGDNSGSIGKKEVTVFASELRGILESLNPQELRVIWCDMSINLDVVINDMSELDALVQDWKANGVKGGGGTSFVPVFDRLQQEGYHPDLMVFFTDGMGTFPAEEPGYHVIWGNITPNYQYPFGEVVDVKIS